MGAGQPEVHGVDLDAGGELGLLERLLDRFDRGLEVDDDAAADPARIGQPTPMTSSDPSSRASPTIAATFDVPTSSPTT